MSADPAPPQCPPGPQAPNSRDPSPMPEIYGPRENPASLPMSSAETPRAETVSPLPSSMDLLTQDSPDSSTSPWVKLPPTSGEERTARKEDATQGKKRRMRTVFSQTQLYVLHDRFLRQKYLSSQQTEELSNILNLSYKQVKNWFLNQRKKSKRWQKSNWPEQSNTVTQNRSATTEYTGFYPCHQGYLPNPSGNLPLWSSQAWNNPNWSSQTWNSQSWSNHSWNSQTWCPQAWNNQAWNNPLHNCEEESLQPPIPSIFETARESHGVLQQSTKYFSTQQIMDFFPNYSEHST
ncbi:unnamed protein product [Nyctereutes procyonoides]|uniref:(raccoon dog) hypothetical protein n=1 Tax=Nyctereutes procyonoides TaxID=34880 RepID=A0A811Z050_NYCPR|nr:unnamed protein product [Nyctereutes procyonoides]